MFIRQQSNSSNGGFQKLASWIESQVVINPTELDFSQYPHSIGPKYADRISNCDLLVSLSKFGEHVNTVKISADNKVENLEFSIIRKNLPNLKKVELKMAPQECKIIAEQLCKMYAKGVIIDAGQVLASHITDEVTKYLIDGNRDNYANYLRKYGINSQTIIPEIFHSAIAIVEKKSRERFAQYAKEDAAKVGGMAKSKLLEDYKTGNGFDMNSNWYINGPQSADDFNDKSLANEAFIMYLVITKLNLWDVFAKSSGKGGLMQSCPKEIESVKTHPAMLDCEHFDGSLAIIEKIAKEGGLNNKSELQATPRLGR